MADLKVLQRSFIKEVEVNQVIFKDKDDSSHGYIFESDEDGIMNFSTHRMESNYLKCLDGWTSGRMTMEERFIIKKIKYPTVALCQCEHLIEMESGITVCPHCRSIYDKRGREIFI